MEADKSTERIVLALMLLDADTSLEVMSRITPDHFRVDIHNMIFVSIAKLYGAGLSKIDELTLVHTITEKYPDVDVNKLQLIVGSVFKSKELVSRDSLAFYVNKLDDVHKKLTFLEFLDKQAEHIKSNLTNNDFSFTDCLNAVETGIIDNITTTTSDEPENIFSELRAFAKELIKEQKEVVGVPTGFPLLDDRIDGMEPGTLTVIAAPKKTGKSTVCMNVALNVAIDQNIPVLYLDTEMTTYKNKTRVLSRITNVPEKRLKRGLVTDKEKQVIEEVTGKLETSVMYFHKYIPGFTLDSVLATIKAYHTKYGIGLVVFDYIKSGAEADFRSMKEHQLLGKITIGLKDLAGVLGIPILTAVQVGRTGDIADSDRIARYADTIIFFQPRTKDEIEELGFEYGMYKFVVKYARSGGTTSESGIGVHFKKPVLSVFEAEKQLGKTEIELLEDQLYQESSEEDSDDQEDMLDSWTSND